MEKIKPITEQEWLLCNEYNRNIMEEFLRNSTQLSPQTIKSYRSNLMIWFNYARANLSNKPQTELKSRDYMFYQNDLINRNHSSADIKNKRAAVSSLNNYIVLFYSDLFPLFKNFIVRGMPSPEKSFVHTKNPVTKAEFANLINELEKRKEWQKIAYLKYTMDTACRRAESRQLLKEVLHYPAINKEKTTIDKDGIETTKTITYYQTNKCRCKGRGKSGKIRKFIYSQNVYDAIKKWMDIRGEDDCPYVFVSKSANGAKQISESSLNNWCSGLFTEIVGRRFFPHSIRSAKATISVVEDGKDIKTIQKLLSHSDIATTSIYIIRDDDEDDTEDLFD